jgi:hypothetical protein
VQEFIHKRRIGGASERKKLVEVVPIIDRDLTHAYIPMSSANSLVDKRVSMERNI